MKKIFISYSRKDEKWKDRLITHLGVLQKQGMLDVWDDTRIGAGDDWYEQIEKAMDSASIAILLISANFLTSDFIQTEEVPRLLERRQEEGMRVIPVIAKPCAWKKVKWLSQIQARPKDGRVLSGGSQYQKDADLAALADEISGLLTKADSDSVEASTGTHLTTLAKGSVSIHPLATIILDKSLDKFTAEERTGFVFALSRFLNIGVDEIQILCVSEGSVRLVIEMSEKTLERLLSAYLDSNPTLRELAIARIQFEYAKPVPMKKPVSCFVKLAAPSLPVLGRSRELDYLDRAWEQPDTNGLIISAWGGVGKTALVNEWLNRMGHDNYRGAERVYGWSFYSQGTREDRQVSGDKFVVHALKWFGDPDPTQGSPWDKGMRLADLIRGQRTLLVLDGLEPLQYSGGTVQGQLKDQGLRALLRELVRSNPGLCIITTREEVEDIDFALSPNLKRIFLENLPVEAGVRLLRYLAVEGTDKELRDAVKDFDGHALALNLLGTYILTVQGGDIRKRDLIPQLGEGEEQGSHAQRVMESYEIRLRDTPELDILHVMGLFDRPAQGSAIEALRVGPAIEGLTHRLQGLSETDWQCAVKHLRSMRLLADQDENEPDKLDCHPLVREYFGQQLKMMRPTAWTEAHQRLFEYYKAVPETEEMTPIDLEKEFPETIEGMTPLYFAVAHGCLAGLHEEAFEIYSARIQRGNEFFSTKKLGMYGTGLSVLSCFFDVRWSKPVSTLGEMTQAAILNAAGFRLRALGRLNEAVQPIKVGLEGQVAHKSWKNAATAAGNLSELYVTLGCLDAATKYGRQSVEFAERSNDLFQLYSKLATLADALYQTGKSTEAKGFFERAEGLQRQVSSEYPYLYSLQGFRFCDLLLGQNSYKQVQERASKTLERSVEQNYLLGIAMDSLSLGTAYLLEAVAQKKADFIKVTGFLNQAVNGLREAGTQHHIPRALLARAGLYRHQQNWEKAWVDLREVKEIAGRGEMNLYLADYHLEAARLCLAEGNRETEARKHYKEAAKRVEEMGYHRRDPEVLLIWAELEIVEGDKESAEKTLDRAKERIDEIGCHRWDFEVERLRNRI